VICVLCFVFWFFFFGFGFGFGLVGFSFGCGFLNLIDLGVTVVVNTGTIYLIVLPF
jgi:hypothetical protein